MILLTTEITEIGHVPKRQLRDMNREAHLRTAQLWNKRYLPGHFKVTKNQRGKYRHKERSKNYEERKHRIGSKGTRFVRNQGRFDNVYTGHMRKLLNRRHVVKAFPTRATISMPGPRYISMRPKDRSRPHKAAEILFVTAAEKEVLADTFDKLMQKMIDGYQGRRANRIK